LWFSQVPEGDFAFLPHGQHHILVDRQADVGNATDTLEGTKRLTQELVYQGANVLT
jgi:hypothetical protein